MGVLTGIRVLDAKQGSGRTALRPDAGGQRHRGHRSGAARRRPEPCVAASDRWAEHNYRSVNGFKQAMTLSLKTAMPLVGLHHSNCRQLLAGRVMPLRYSGCTRYLPCCAVCPAWIWTRCDRCGPNG